MYRNKVNQGFKSLVFTNSSTSNSECHANNAEESSNNLVRSTSQILRFFNRRKKDYDKNSILKISEKNKKVPEVVNEKENEWKQKDGDFKLIFNVVFGKITSKKHKTWDNDGFLQVSGKNAVLKDLDENIIGRTTVNPQNVDEGTRLFIGNKEVEVISLIKSQDLNLHNEHNDNKTENEPPKKKFKNSIGQSVILPEPSNKGLKLQSQTLKMPALGVAKSLLDDNNAKEEQDVFVDSCLTNVLRPHQCDGIIFLYECIMGIKTPNHFGAILADEMGLGKTLQCITLSWTLLKKGPFGKSVLKRVLIVTPSSLCNNWKKEFIHWLGSHRVVPFVVDAKNKPQNFMKQPRSQILIISYEMFIRYHEEISQINFDLVICDEGHRLKNSNIQTAKLLNDINCKRRILLSGTPIQNDLQEFYTLVEFVNPGILGNSTEYKRHYEDPIVASQSPHASEDEVLLGKERAKELYDKTTVFILRRTQDIINKYLPCKHEIVLFCNLSDEQKNLYSLVTDFWFDKTVIPEKNVPHLTIIMALKKICNHTSLFTNEKDNFLSDNSLYQELTKTTDINTITTKYCGKITVVQTLMRNLKSTDEKLVLISYYTQTLDLFEIICNMEQLKFFRLDGSTQSAIRTKIIEQFNSKTDDSRVFLLSAKAGGVGLNLPGASRLVLVDSDWNPASDAQAMARIWRDGQKKSVYVYRLLMTGTIEEKIYQRQISKTNLSEIVVDANNLSSLKLSSSELKDLFSLSTDTESITHDLMKCKCKNQVENIKDDTSVDAQFSDVKYESARQNLTINQLVDWEHYVQPFSEEMVQEFLLTEMSKHISCIFKSSTIQKNKEELNIT